MGPDEAETIRTIAANAGIHRMAPAHHRGHLIKELGDGMPASFVSAPDAATVAREIQRQVVAEGRFQVRAGIHLGEVIQDGGRFMGDGAIIAARIQAEIGPGEIGISSTVFANVRNRDGVSAGFLGDRTLEGLPEPVGHYSVAV